MKKIIWIFLICMIGICVAGCGSGGSTKESTVSESREDESGIETVPESADSISETEENGTEFKDVMEFMMDEYGFEEEELEIYDLIRLMKDYDFKNLDYTADEVREILEDQGQYYQNDGYTLLFYALDAEEGGKLDRESGIRRIGFYYNEGTLIRKVMYDLDEKKIYDNTTEPKEMTEEQVRALTGLASDYNIYEWDNYYSGEEESGSTGSLRWKLMFECSDGSRCMYGGYTQDMTHLPARFSEIKNLLLSMTK